MVTFQFIPFQDVENLGSAKRVNKLLNIVKEDKIVIMEGRLKKEEEADLIEITMEEHDYVYPTDEEWWSSLWSHGIRARFEQLEAPDLEKLKSDMVRKVQVLKQADGIHTVFRALFARAQKPS